MATALSRIRQLTENLPPLYDAQDELDADQPCPFPSRPHSPGVPCLPLPRTRPVPALSTDRALGREAVRALEYQLGRLRAHLDEAHIEAEIGINRKWCADTLIEIVMTAHAYSQAFRAREA